MVRYIKPNAYSLRRDGAAVVLLQVAL